MCSFIYLYVSPNVIRVIKSMRMRWVGHVAHMADRRGAYRSLVVEPEGKIHLEDLGIGGSILLKWIFKKWDEEAWSVLIWLRIVTGGRSL